jgi:hypothetical protein
LCNGNRHFRTSHDEVPYGLYKTGYVARLEENECMHAEYFGGKFMDNVCMEDLE